MQLEDSTLNLANSETGTRLSQIKIVGIAFVIILIITNIVSFYGGKYLFGNGSNVVDDSTQMAETSESEQDRSNMSNDTFIGEKQVILNVADTEMNVYIHESYGFDVEFLNSPENESELAFSEEDVESFLNNIEFFIDELTGLVVNVDLENEKVYGVVQIQVGNVIEGTYLFQEDLYGGSFEISSLELNPEKESPYGFLRLLDYLPEKEAALVHRTASGIGCSNGTIELLYRDGRDEILERTSTCDGAILHSYDGENLYLATGEFEEQATNRGPIREMRVTKITKLDPITKTKSTIPYNFTQEPLYLAGMMYHSSIFPSQFDERSPQLINLDKNILVFSKHFNFDNELVSLDIEKGSLVTR